MSFSCHSNVYDSIRSSSPVSTTPPLQFRLAIFLYMPPRESLSSFSFEETGACTYVYVCTYVLVPRAYSIRSTRGKVTFSKSPAKQSAKEKLSCRCARRKCMQHRNSICKFVLEFPTMTTPRVRPRTHKRRQQRHFFSAVETLPEAMKEDLSRSEIPSPSFPLL